MGELQARHTPKWILISLAILINLIWAMSYPVSKVVMDRISPLSLTCWRLATGGFLLVPFLRRQDFPVKVTYLDVTLIFVMGALGCAGATLLQYLGTTKTLASNVSLIVALETVAVLFLANWILKERIRLSHLISLVLAVIGVCLITLEVGVPDITSSQYLSGNLLMIASIFLYAAYTICGKLLVTRWTARALTALPFVLSSLIVIPVSWWWSPAEFYNGLRLSGLELSGVLFIGLVSTSFCYLVWNWLLKWMPARDLSYFIYIQSASGPVFSYFLLHERLTTAYFFGAGFILLAVFTEQKFSRP